MFRRLLTRRRLIAATSVSVAGGGGLYLYASRNDRSLKPGQAPTSTLLRSYAVFSMCDIPALVDYSPQLLEVFSSVPVVKQITEAFVRATFFNQFVGGDTAHETIPVLRQLRQTNKGALFAYSVEVDEHEATGHESAEKQDVSKRIVNEMIRCIDVADEFEKEVGSEQRKTWVAVKITALLPNASSLINLSKHLVASRPPSSKRVAFPGAPNPTDLDVLHDSRQGNTYLTSDEIDELRKLYNDLDRICARAQEKGVKIIMDAEYSWYQPAIDAMTFALMRKYNAMDQKPTTGDSQPLIYATYQAYLRRTPELLAETLEQAKRENYSLGIKLVRGAYHPYEIAAHPLALPPSSASTMTVTNEHDTPSISPDPQPPVWEHKSESDACYDNCVRTILEQVAKDVSHPTRNNVPRIGALFGTHNWNSSNLILEESVRHGLATKERDEEGKEVVVLKDAMTERVTVGQLYGMGDALSDYMAGKTRSKAPFVMR
jgi:proline dehydrogenase